MSSEALPEGDLEVWADGDNPGMCRSTPFGSNTDECVKAKAQQQTTEQYGVVLTVLNTNRQTRTNSILHAETTCFKISLLFLS